MLSINLITALQCVVIEVPSVVEKCTFLVNQHAQGSVLSLRLRTFRMGKRKPFALRREKIKSYRLKLKLFGKKKNFRTKTKKLSTFPGQCSKIWSAQRYLSHILKSSCFGSKSVVAKVLTHRLQRHRLKGIRAVLEAHEELKIV